MVAFFRSLTYFFFYLLLKKVSSLRIYRKFYKIDYVDGSNDTYTFIDPIYLSANTYNLSSSSFVENLTVNYESQGIYYVDLNNLLYNYSDTYEINWHVRYIDSSPYKVLTTRFKYEPNNYITELAIELENNQNINYEINDQGLDYEINSSN